MTKPSAKKTGVIRCPWPSDDELMIRYHDEEWGVPLHDDARLFEFLVLESMQAGLSWRTILHKRENFRKAFHQFDYERIARYGQRDVDRLLQDAGIIRNRLKIAATINNARQYIEVRKEFGTFDKYIWGFMEKRKPINNSLSSLKGLPARTELSDKISVDMIKRGFKFMGSTIVYAHMQATGMVNDHMNDCFRKKL